MLPQSHSSCSARTSPFFPRENEGGMVPRKYNVKLTYSLLKMSKLKSFYTWESGTFWKSFTKFAALKDSKYSNFDIFNNEQAWRGWNQRLKSTRPPREVNDIWKRKKFGEVLKAFGPDGARSCTPCVFPLQRPYIQSREAQTNLMRWLSKKSVPSRQSLSSFAMFGSQ